MARRSPPIRSLAIAVTIAVLACNGDSVDVPTTGGLQITSTTSGPIPDADGYVLTVDGTERGILAPAGEISIEALAPGNHTIGLTGVAAHCAVQGTNPRTVTVSSGSTRVVSFSVVCSATTGAIQVSVTSAGSPTDPDGYLVQLDGTAPGQPIPTNGTTTFTGVETGHHNVSLTDVALNCTVSDGYIREVTIQAGVTSNISFEVVCTPASLEITTLTTGTSLDPDGYSVIVDYDRTQSIGINATLPVSGLAEGDHSVTITGLASNCVLQGDNPLTVTTADNALATVRFTISCSTPVEANWTRMASGNTTAFLSRISGTSATNIFVAGPTTILHYDGSAWSTQLQLQTGEIRDVWAASSTDAFALGTGWPSSGPYFLRYDGLQWSSMKSPGVDVEDGSLLALWGSSSNDVFAVGSFWPYGGYDYRAYVAHYDGATWSPMDVGPRSCGLNSSFDCYVQLTGVWGSSGTDVYAVGNFHVPLQDEDEAVILHHNGHQWSEVLRESRLQLYNVWGSSSNDVYATGSTLVPSGQCHGCLTGGDGAIRHFDGSGWSTIPSPTSAGLRAIWGSSSTDIYLLSGDRGSIWHFNGARWTQMTTGVSELADIWGSSANDVFAVGADGTILHGP
jgi:hypothetical protein